MNRRTILITGGNSGIGLQCALQLVEQGHKVIIACRNTDRAQTAVKVIQEISKSEHIHFLKMDMSLQSSIHTAWSEYQKEYGTLDVLIHNAADFDISRTKAEYTEEGIERLWATNHIGPILLTKLALPLLKQSPDARIITIASKGLMIHPFLKINYEDINFLRKKYRVDIAYYQSKLAQMMFSYWLARQLTKDNILVNCIRVTNVKIDLNRYPKLSKLHKFLYSIKKIFSIPPSKMAIIYTYLATSNHALATTGKYFDENGKMVRSSSYSLDENEQNTLVKFSFQFLINHTEPYI
ncbi:MAG: SDR family NAD(P)-dependent oxidoreductase [Leptospira sp.]|nr:SDR family NAD(P)-dependent oxidoreductase [Leptospira sp.]